MGMSDQADVTNEIKGRLKLKQLQRTTKVIIVVSLNMHLAATDITQFLGPATFVFALQVSDKSFPMTPPHSLMACCHEPIQKLLRTTESIFEHQAKRFSRIRNLTRGFLSSWS
jgi:hypothetical protein